jgi:hypothetical protein
LSFMAAIVFLFFWFVIDILFRETTSSSSEELKSDRGSNRPVTMVNNS